ncbi:MAG: putative lipid II flippase FtsW [Omnitrophica bacterium]|nr:putative lipid II flippase FtsW [Candidatus Omnitrophota bacterium]
MIITQNKISKLNLKDERRFIFSLILGITLLGLLMVYESSSIYAFKTTTDAAYFFKRQALFFILGILSFCLTLLLDLELLRRYSKEFLLFTLFFLVVVVLLGKNIGGARRWLSLGNFNLQPSEILKISFLVYCADYCSRRKNLIRSVKAGLMPLGLVLGLVCVLLLLQPDLGAAVFWVVWLLIFLFVFKAKNKHLIFIIFSGLAAMILLIFQRPYRLRRVVSYLNPFSDPQGAGFQLVQSQIAYGLGGIWGVGLGEGRQKLFFLPAAHTDFVFSIIAEELGLLGSLGVIFAFFLVFHKMFVIALVSDNGFKKGILWGVVFIFFLEVLMNIGVSCGVFPTKGLPLPFMSYGGSNLIVHYILLGLFFNASREEQAGNK